MREGTKNRGKTLKEVRKMKERKFFQFRRKYFPWTIHILKYIEYIKNIFSIYV